MKTYRSVLSGTEEGNVFIHILAKGALTGHICFVMFSFVFCRAE